MDNEPQGQPEPQYTDLGDIIKAAPVPPKWKKELGPLFLSPHEHKRLAGWHWLYPQIVPIFGEIIECGVGYGRDIAMLANLRHLYEPHAPRKIIGIDTFAGLPAEDITTQDGYKAVPGYYEFDDGDVVLRWLVEVLGAVIPDHPSSDHSPIDLMPGKSQEVLPKILNALNTPVAMLMIDMCQYDAARCALRDVVDYLVPGSIITFNQFYTPAWRSEAAALREVYGFDGHKVGLRGRLVRNPYHRYWAHWILDGRL